MTPGALFDGDRAKYYEQRTRRVVTGFDLLHDLSARAMAALAPKNARVLCLGAGTATEIVELQKHRADISFLAVDPSPEMVEQGRERCSDVEFLVGTLADVDPAAKFDAVTAHLVFHFMKDDFFTQTLHGLAIRLSPGAPLVFSQMEGTDDPLYRQLWESMGNDHNPPDVTSAAYDAIRGGTALRNSGTIDAVLATAGFEEPVRFFRGGHFVAGATRLVGSSPGTIPA